MKHVKAIDIARELGISKASVSLALNDKPGVSAQKKEEILECKRRLEAELNGGSAAPASSFAGEKENTVSAFSPEASQNVNEMSGILSRSSSAITETPAVYQPSGSSSIPVQPASSSGFSETNSENISPDFSGRTETQVINLPPVSIQKQIRLVFMNRDVTAAWEQGNDFPGEVMSAFAAEVRAAGYTLGVTYCTTAPESIASLAAECNVDSVAGIVIHATELSPKDAAMFQCIHKPLVFYDCEVEKGIYHSITADNRIGVYEAMDRFFRKGLTDVIYLAHSETIFNFSERRRWFQTYLLSHGKSFDECRQIYFIGLTPKEMLFEMKKWLKEHPLPQAFLMENYQVSTSVVRALQEEGYRIPEDISLIGIDSVSSFYLNGLHLTHVKVPHRERAELTIDILLREIENPIPIKSKILTYCSLVEGDSVI